MDKLLLSRLRFKIDSTVSYLTPLLPMANCHMVEYIKENNWEKFVPEDILNEVNTHGIEAAIESFWYIKNNLGFTSQKNIFNSFSDEIESSIHIEKFPHLSNFVENANIHGLSESDFCMTFDQFTNKLKTRGACSTSPPIKIPEFMSSKKSHEVAMLSSVLETLYNWSESTHVVDMGGGKGYLSSLLTMAYNIPVLNIDSSPINALGAAKRNNKMKKLWPTLLKKAVSNKGVPLAKNDRIQINENDLKKINLSNENTSNEIKYSENSKHDLYKHVTEFITPKTDILNLIEQNFDVKENNKKLCFTGLHTCGSLGSTIPQLFTKCSSASILCVIPCCYHLINEHVETDSLSSQPENHAENGADFPMSEYLKGFCIGRNARMLGCQSLERVSAERQLPCRSIYYRALLEVLLGDRLNQNMNPYSKLKNVGDSLTSFHDYVNMAVKKLNIDTKDLKLDEVTLRDFELSYNHQKETLDLFYLLRMCLSPVIESLILLDRLMFLIENGFCKQLGEAFLVRLFDSVLSPRCMALVAFRYEKK